MASGETGPLATLRRRPRLAASLALVGAWVVFFARAIFTDGVPYAGDILSTTLPLRQYLRDRIAAGEWPQWYPNELFGAPFLGGVLASPFHPQMLLLLPFKAAVATKWTLVLAYLFALIGAYRLARSLGTTRVAAVVGAYAFAFGGYAIGLANNMAYLVPLATAPWALHATIRLLQRQKLRHAAALGLAWALVLLGGDAQLLMELVAMAGAALLLSRGWRRTGLMALSGVVALLLCAPEILPATVIGAESFRAEWRVTDALGERWALHPLRLIELAMPGLSPPHWGNDVGRLLLTGKEGSWSTSFFAGGTALCLAALALVQRKRKAIVLAVVAIFFVWLALGTYGGLLPIVWKIAPGLAKLRFPEKYAAVAWILLAPLVAMGVDAFRAAPRRATAVFGVAATLVIAVAAWCNGGGMVDWAFGTRGLHLANTDPLWSVLRDTWTRGLLATGIALGLGAVIAWRAPRPGLIGMLLLAELSLAHVMSVPLASSAAVEAISPLASRLTTAVRPGEPAPRVLPMPENAFVPPNLSAEESVSVQHSYLRPDDGGSAGVVSFDHNLSTETGRTMRLLYGKPALDASTWLPRFNVCYRLLGPRDVLLDEDRLLETLGRVRLVEQACSPRAFLAAARPVENAVDAQSAVQTGLPDATVVWEKGPERSAAEGSVRWLEARPERLRLEVTATAPTALIVTDAFATGWSATVDGQPATIYPTDVAVRGVSVDAGKHVVEMVYRAPLFKLGLALFVIGLLLMAALAVRLPSRLEPAETRRVE